MRRSGATTAILLLLIASAAQSQESQPSALRAGAAAVDISPVTLPALRNGGFLQASSDRVDDPLYARTLVITDGVETIAIVIVDSCMFATGLCDEIKRLAAHEVGLRKDRILISATHTHSAPAATELCLGCGADDAYVEYVPARVAQAIVDAYRDLRPAKVGWAVVDGSEFTNCRRWITRSDRMGTDPFGDRTVRAMMHPGYRNPDYVSPAGPIDPWLSVVSVISAEDDAPLCLMANLSMHYFGAGRGFSADYFGEVARILESQFGAGGGEAASGLVGIVSQGTSGDLHWMDYSQPPRSLSRREYAESVAERILEARNAIEHRSDLNLAMEEKRLSIGRRIPSRGRLEWARPINKARGDVPPRNLQEVYAQQAEWIHENPRAEVVLQAVRIGQLGITAIPNEVYGITGLKLKRQSPLEATVNLELANGAEGYIPPPEQHRLGGYTTWPARSAGLEEQAEPIIVETMLELLESVAGRERKSLSDPKHPYAQEVERREPVAYWRLGDMNATHAADAAGRNDADYHGGVALFLRGPEGPGLATSGYGNRAVYLAGGRIEGNVPPIAGDYSVSLWFWNGLPIHARGVTGTLLTAAGETLSIAGNAANDRAGRLVLTSDARDFFGEAPIATKEWHHLTVVRQGKRVRVFIDGQTEPEIDADVEQVAELERIVIAGDESKSAFDGKVDEVAVFDRALAAKDVARLYAVAGATPPARPRPAVMLNHKPFDAVSLKRYADAVMASQPTAFWRLHDATGAAAEDQNGRYPGTYEPGAEPVDEQRDAPNFTGGRVKAAVSELGTTYSIELWVRNDLPNDARPVTGYIFSRGVDGAAGAPGDNLGIGGTYLGGGRLFVFNGNQQNQSIAGRTPIPRGSWSHIVMVRRDERITVYLNGDPEPELDGQLPIAFPAGSGELALGGRSDNFANLQGIIEEVALYDRALPAAEIKTHFDAAGVTPLTPDTNAATPAHDAEELDE